MDHPTDPIDRSRALRNESMRARADPRTASARGSGPRPWPRHTDLHPVSAQARARAATDVPSHRPEPSLGTFQAPQIQ